MRARPAELGWLGLVAYVTVVDGLLIAGEKRGRDRYCTMSTVFKEALDRPIVRWQLVAMWLIVTFHLFPIILPPKWRAYEPMGLTARVVSSILSNMLPQRSQAYMDKIGDLLSEKAPE